MIKSFISLVTSDLLRSHGQELKDLAVVFPNRRAGSLFRRELVRQIPAPTWSPAILSIDDWLVSISGLILTDRLTELILLFQVVKQQFPNFDSFSDFLDLGETILTDFDDVDKYLADPQKLFTTLNELKKIDSHFDITSDEELIERIRIFWTSFGAGHSAHQEKWLEIWDRLLFVYKAFHKCLKDKGMGTSGMCYRKAAEDMISGKISTGRYKKIAFAGFNILTTAEETIFSYLRDNGIAQFYWDYHPFYLDDSHEAGKFVKHYLSKFPQPSGFDPFPDNSQNFFNSTPEEAVINIVPVTSNTGQVQALLNTISSAPKVSRGIVLSDEGLFSDILSSWPDDGLPVNFTSGYPLRDTQAAGFLLKVLDIFMDFNASPDKKYCRTALILAFLRHPWSRLLTGDSDDSGVHLIQRRFPEFVPAEYLKNHARLSAWIAVPAGTQEILDRIGGLFSGLNAFESLYSNLEKAAIGMIGSQAIYLKESLKYFELDPDPKALSKLFRQFVNTGKITLETDRDASNQVTGILETRLVDFEEVVILSFNEGIWPSKSLPGSLIPYSMRKVFQLPTAENRDAMYAYYFYRLIQRTQSLNLYFLTGHMDDNIRSGEKSRYITQLLYEFRNRVAIRPEPPVRIGKRPAPVIIRKEGMVSEKLNRYLSDGTGNKSLSPSAINEYLDCSLRFALKRIFDFREPDEIAYASEPKGFGILIHQVMNRLYSDFSGRDKGPGTEWLQGVIDDREELDKIIRAEYNSVLKESGSVNPGGKEILAMEVVRQFLVRILEYDKLAVPFRIVGLEQNCLLQYPVLIDNQKVKVNINGIIDRIDKVGEGIRIIDYKTGNCELNFRAISDLFNKDGSGRPKEAFQVLLYCELFGSGSETGFDLIPGLFRLGRFRSGDPDYRIKLAGADIVYSRIREEFNNGLQAILEEIFNPEISFIQTDNEQACRYCPFTGLCDRNGYS